MSDEQIMSTYEKLKQHFGDKLPDPEHSPLQFAYFVKIYKYYHENRQN
jgi:hypothetical protein